MCLTPTTTQPIIGFQLLVFGCAPRGAARRQPRALALGAGLNGNNALKGATEFGRATSPANALVCRSNRAHWFTWPNPGLKPWANIGRHFVAAEHWANDVSYTYCDATEN